MQEFSKMEDEIRIIVTLDGKRVDEYFTCPKCGQERAVHFIAPHGEWVVCPCGFKFGYTRQKQNTYAVRM